MKCDHINKEVLFADDKNHEWFQPNLKYLFSTTHRRTLLTLGVSWSKVKVVLAHLHINKEILFPDDKNQMTDFNQTWYTYLVSSTEETYWFWGQLVKGQGHSD